MSFFWYWLIYVPSEVLKIVNSLILPTLECVFNLNNPALHTNSLHFIRRSLEEMFWLYCRRCLCFTVCRLTEWTIRYLCICKMGRIFMEASITKWCSRVKEIDEVFFTRMAQSLYLSCDKLSYELVKFVKKHEPKSERFSIWPSHGLFLENSLETFQEEQYGQQGNIVGI